MFDFTSEKAPITPGKVARFVTFDKKIITKRVWKVAGFSKKATKLATDLE